MTNRKSVINDVQSYINANPDNRLLEWLSTNLPHCICVTRVGLVIRMKIEDMDKLSRWIDSL